MKKIVVIAGPNGSGKSTLAGQIDIPGKFINADNCEKRLFANIADKDIREKQAAIAVASEIKAFIAAEKSFAFETVFSVSKIPDFLVIAKKKGYKISLHYIATDKPEINIVRVAKRVSEGGHDVPKQTILDRYAKSLEILPKLLDFVDTAIVYDNSNEKLRAFLVKEDEQIKIVDTLPLWAESRLHFDKE